MEILDENTPASNGWNNFSPCLQVPKKSHREGTHSIPLTFYQHIFFMKSIEMFYKSYHSTDSEWQGEGDLASGIPVLTTVPSAHPKQLSLKPFKPHLLKNIEKTYPMLMSEEAKEWFKLVVDEECFPNHNIVDPSDYFHFKKFTYLKWLTTYNTLLENLALQDQISKDRGRDARVTVLHGVGRFAWGDDPISLGTGEMLIIRSDDTGVEPFYLCEVLKILSTDDDNNDEIIKYKLCFWIKDEQATKGKGVSKKNKKASVADSTLDDIFDDDTNEETDTSSQLQQQSEDESTMDAKQFIKSDYLSQWLTCKWKKSNSKVHKNCITITQNQILLYDFSLYNKCFKKSTAEKIRQGIYDDILDGSFVIPVLA